MIQQIKDLINLRTASDTMVMKRYELQDIAQLLERNAPEIASPIAEKRQVYKLI